MEMFDRVLLTNSETGIYWTHCNKEHKNRHKISREGRIVSTTHAYRATTAEKTLFATWQALWLVNVLEGMDSDFDDSSATDDDR
jgi:hypothetical protein